MQQPGDTRHTTTKRMRLGTKSCAECRRRKVRCVFPPKSSICQECALHKTPCAAQKTRPNQARVAEAADNTTLQRRVDELEAMLDGLVRSLDPAGSSSSSSVDLGLRTAQVISQYQRRQSQTSGAASPSQPARRRLPDTASLSPSIRDNTDTLIGSGTGKSPATDAPLAKLFRDALLVRDNHGGLVDHPEDSLFLPSTQDILEPIRPPLPDTETIHLILEDTKQFWPLWPPYFYDVTKAATLQPEVIDIAKDAITDALDLGQGPVFCKAMMWLALCIQQLPRQWRRPIVHSSIKTQSLIDSYIRFVNISQSVEVESSLEGIHCLIMQYKLLINMGRPQRAWLSVRRAVAASTVLGLHLMDRGADYVSRSTWSLVWQLDKSMSLMVGLPSSITSPLVLDSNNDPSEPTYYRLLRQVSILSAHVIERNENSKTATYATTVTLDQEAEELRQLFPSEWWHPLPPDGPMHAIYYQETAKFMYFMLVKLIHIPYMLKSVSDRRYEHSRVSTVEASREMIWAYLRVRGSSTVQMIQCELMDFHAFSAAVALIISLLSSPATTPRLQIGDDQKLVKDLAIALRETGELLDCSVAEQGARALGSLLEVIDAGQDHQADFIMAIPYFGKLRVHPVQRSRSNYNDVEMPATTEGRDIGQATQWLNTFEFLGEEFLGAAPVDFDMDMDLVQDWANIVGDCCESAADGRPFAISDSAAK